MNNQKVTKGFFYKLIERCGYQGIYFIVTIILARILEPSDFGVLTILTVFVNISQVFVQTGLCTALVQKKETDEIDFSSIFYINLGVVIILYLLLFILAPYIAKFFEMPEISSTLRVLALILFPGAINSIQNAKIVREFQFKKLFLCSVPSITISGIIGIGMAYLGFGVWALVAQQILNTCLLCVIMWFTVQWRPKAIFSIERVKTLFSFGWKLLLSSLLDTIYQDLRNLIIGKKYTSDMLGYYNKGEQFPRLVVQNINNSLQTVLLPAMSSVQDQNKKIRAMTSRAIRIGTYIIFPIMAGLISVADELVLIVLTDKWLPCVPFLRLCCIIYAFWPLNTSNLQAMSAKGRSDLYLKLEVIKKILGVSILCITTFCFESVFAIVIGMVIYSPIGFLLNAYPNRKLIGYKTIDEIKDALPAILLSATMGISVYMIGIVFELSTVLLFIVKIIWGVFVYIALSWIFKCDSFFYLIKTTKSLFSK